MRSILITLLCTLLVLAPDVASSQNAPATQPISLNQALERAVAGNVALRRDRVTIQIADANLLAARGQFDFVLTSALNFQRSTEPSLSAQDIVGGYTNVVGFDIGVSRQLETGGNVRLFIENDGIDTNAQFQCGGLGTCFASNLGLTFNHPLWRGLGPEVTLANIRKQKIQKDLALLNRQMRAANVLRDVIVAYWELAYATQDLAIRRSAVDLALEQLRITKAQIDVGRLAPIDQAAVERAIGDRMQDVAISEQNQYDRALDLRRLLGIPADPTLPIFAAVDMPIASPRPVDVVDEVKRALEMNPQLRSLKTGLELNAIDIQTALSTTRPRLDFVSTVGSRGRKNTLPDTLVQTVGLDEFTWSAGLNFQLPVENRTANGQLRGARLVEEQARLDAGALELDIRDTVMRVSGRIRTASLRVDLAKQTVGYAQQNLEAERARFSVGRSTNNDVLLRQQELKNAEISVVRATVDLLNSDVALSAVTAEILDRYNVMLKGLD